MVLRRVFGFGLGGKKLIGDHSEGSFINALTHVICIYYL